MKNYLYRNALLYAAVLTLLGAAVLLTSCGSSSTDAVDSTTRLISGEIATQDSALLSKYSNTTTSDADTADCIDTLCSVRAMNALGQGENGEIYRWNNRWQIRLRAGTWMIGFYNQDEELEGYLEINGEQTFKLEAGDDIDLGQMTHRYRHMVMFADVEGLGEMGFRSAYGRDCDFDGILDSIDSDTECAADDPTIFSIIKVKPYAGHKLVAPCRPIKIVFNQAVDEATLNSDSIIVTDANGAVVEGEFGYEEHLDDESGLAEYVVRFTPLGAYELGDEITVSVSSSVDGVLNLLGEVLDQDYIWSFTVRDFGGSNPSCHDPDQEYNRERQRAKQD
ncbi:MAG: Ig-like domain-containing protein [Pseudomonadota bacterium]